MGTDRSERVCDIYLITMLLVFPLFFGFSGYSQITISKYVLLLTATGLWLGALGVLALRRQLGPMKRCPAQAAALAMALIAVLSWLFSGDMATSFLGAGRFDGLLSTLVYLLIFLGVSAFARPKALHLRAFALAAALMLCVALLQLAGRNPLRLYPRDLGFYDNGIRYSGVYLATVGNTNLLDAILCLALPAFLALYVCGIDWFPMVPAALAVPVLQKAGGDGLKLACALTALVFPPLLCTDLSRVRRALRALAWLLLFAGLGALWQPDADAALRFAFSGRAAALLLAAAAAAGLSLCPLPASFAPGTRALRRFFALCAGAAALLGLLWLLLAPHTGTLYEIAQTLRGQAEESFGSSRIRIWRACLALVPQRPLLGCGPGMLAAKLDVQFARYVPETGQTLRSFADNAHNVYLGTLVNTGVFGLAAHLAVLGLAAAQAVKKRDDPLAAPLAVGLLCAAIHAFFGLGLSLSEPLFWLALGMLCACASREKTPPVPPEEETV